MKRVAIPDAVPYDYGLIGTTTLSTPLPGMPDILYAYLITFGWAIVGSVSMGIGIIIALKLFALSTRKVDEWELIKQGNISMAIVLAAVILSLGWVVSAAINP